MRKYAFVAASMVMFFACLLFGSNLGFKQPRLIKGAAPEGSAQLGRNEIALPYRVAMSNARDLLSAIGCANAKELLRYVESANTIQTYRCPPFAPGVNFALTAGEGVTVIAKNVADFTYVITGSHDSTVAVQIDGYPASKIGKNVVALPYNFTGRNAKDLAVDIGCANISEVRNYIEATNSLQTYRCPPLAAGANFALVPGVAYYVIGKPDVSFAWVPSHY